MRNPARPTVPGNPVWVRDEARHLLAQQLNVSYHASEDLIIEMLELQFARGLVTPTSLVLWMELAILTGYTLRSGVTR